MIRPHFTGGGGAMMSGREPHFVAYREIPITRDGSVTYRTEAFASGIDKADIEHWAFEEHRNTGNRVWARDQRTGEVFAERKRRPHPIRFRLAAGGGK